VRQERKGKTREKKRDKKDKRDKWDKWDKHNKSWFPIQKETSKTTKCLALLFLKVTRKVRKASPDQTLLSW
jgi:hypothetical protein